jgi:hypothetical protein
MRNINTPKTKVYVRGDAFGENASEFEPAWLVSVRALRHRPLCWQVWVPRYAACFDKVPPHCLYWYEPEKDHRTLDLHQVQMWECLSGSIELWRKDQLTDVPVIVNLGKGHTIRGHYLWTIDYIPEGQHLGVIDTADADLLDEHKEGNVVRLSNGQIAIYPNNRLKWLPVSLTPEGAAARIPQWEAASNERWDEWWHDSDEVLGNAKWAY